MLIPKRVFAVSRVASREATRVASRHAIEGVLVERTADGGCVAVATDGWRMVVVRWSDEEARQDYPSVSHGGVGDVGAVDGFRVVVPMGLWNDASKLGRRDQKRPVLECVLLDEGAARSGMDEGAAREGCGRIVMSATDLEGTKWVEGCGMERSYPQWRDVVPEYEVGEDAVEVRVNAGFLADVARVVRDIGTDEESAERRGMRLTAPRDGVRAVRMDAGLDGVEVTGLLMPMMA